MIRTRVGVIRGGTGSEADLSLKTGSALLHALPEEEYDVRDIFIDKEGVWYARGVAVQPLSAVQDLDVALNALHGGIGEDGTVARILDAGRVPYTGSRPLGALQSLNKARARELLRDMGIRMPRAITVSVRDNTTIHGDSVLRTVLHSFPPPYIIKPTFEGASHGIVYAQNILELGDVLVEMLRTYSSIVIEEYVRGQEATVGVIEHFREQELYALPPASVGLPSGHRFIPSSAYREGIAMRVPAPEFNYRTKQELMHYAREAHKALGLEHYSRSDFIVSPHGIYLLEVNALPGLYEGAAIPTMLDTVGSSVPELTIHAIQRERAVR